MNIATIPPELIDALDTACSELDGAWYKERNATRRRQLRRKLDAACRASNRAVHQARKEFADAHGWQYSPRLSRHHCDVFVFPKTRRIAATVVFYHADQP